MMLKKGVYLSKKRSNGEGSISKRKDGRWECAIMIGYQKDGRRKRKSFYGTTKAEALKKMHDYQEAVAKGEIPKENMLFTVWADTWFEGHKQNVSASTRESYQYTLTAIKRKLEGVHLHEIRALDVEALLKAFRDEGKSDSYVSKARGMLFQIMQKAEANDLIRRNPVAAAEKMKAFKPAQEKEAFTAEEVKALLQNLPHDRMGDSIRLMLGTGIRMQELLALEPQHIEPDGSAIHIRQTVKTVSGKVEIGPPKSKESKRDVPIPESLRTLVIGLRDTPGKYIIQSPNLEQPFDPNHYRDKFKKYVSAVKGVRVLTPHSCRHTFVSQMQALGVDMPTIQSLVGHADMDMTQHYLHVQNPVKQQAVQIFDSAFGKNAENQAGASL